MLHPHYLEHFSDPLYDTDEEGPLCTDEGADLLSVWIERQGELSQSSSVRDIMVTAAGGIARVDALVQELRDDGGPDAAETLISAGFVLIALTGQIDQTGRSWVAAALERSHDFYGDRALHYDKIRRDLETFGSGTVSDQTVPANTPPLHSTPPAAAPKVSAATSKIIPNLMGHLRSLSERARADLSRTDREEPDLEHPDRAMR